MKKKGNVFWENEYLTPLSPVNLHEFVVVIIINDPAVAIIMLLWFQHIPKWKEETKR